MNTELRRISGLVSEGCRPAQRNVVFSVLCNSLRLTILRWRVLVTSIRPCDDITGISSGGSSGGDWDYRPSDDSKGGPVWAMAPVFPPVFLLISRLSSFGW